MNKSITVIPARKRVGNTVSKEEKPKLRVAAYCRVSTDSDEQATSYETQMEHYTNYIQRNPEWEFAGIFADDGISGTNTKKREEFNRMIEECMVGHIDYDYYKVHQPICKKYTGLSEIYPFAERKEHSRIFREREHQHYGFKGRGSFNYYGKSGTTGIGIIE